VWKVFRHLNSCYCFHLSLFSCEPESVSLLYWMLIYYIYPRTGMFVCHVFIPRLVCLFVTCPQTGSFPGIHSWSAASDETFRSVLQSEHCYPRRQDRGARVCGHWVWHLWEQDVTWRRGGLWRIQPRLSRTSVSSRTPWHHRSSIVEGGGCCRRWQRQFCGILVSFWTISFLCGKYYYVHPHICEGADSHIKRNIPHLIH